MVLKTLRTHINPRYFIVFIIYGIYRLIPITKSEQRTFFQRTSRFGIPGTHIIGMPQSAFTDQIEGSTSLTNKYEMKTTIIMILYPDNGTTVLLFTTCSIKMDRKIDRSARTPHHRIVLPVKSDQVCVIDYRICPPFSFGSKFFERFARFTGQSLQSDVKSRIVIMLSPDTFGINHPPHLHDLGKFYHRFPVR